MSLGLRPAPPGRPARALPATGETTALGRVQALLWGHPRPRAAPGPSQSLRGDGPEPGPQTVSFVYTACHGLLSPWWVAGLESGRLYSPVCARCYSLGALDSPAARLCHIPRDTEANTGKCSRIWAELPPARSSAAVAGSSRKQPCQAKRIRTSGSSLLAWWLRTWCGHCCGSAGPLAWERAPAVGKPNQNKEREASDGRGRCGPESAF